MSAFLWTLLVIESLGALGTFAELMGNKYPKTSTTSVRAAVIGLLGQIATVFWTVCMFSQVRP